MSTMATQLSAVSFVSAPAFVGLRKGGGLQWLTFELGVPALRSAQNDSLDWRDAVVETYLTLLAASPDTHIARKLGRDAAATVQRRARAVRDAGGVRTAAGRAAIADLDRELRDDANTLNPGATADLTGAAIYAVLLEGGWRVRR